ncbi:amidohydrolase [Natronincola ferrireducens]|uniref:Amidohydrolase 3 domain-containing protein n=1 Tax=Natronincola ferrireducens TaxID=393762 RepID=A0A1G8X0M4_9FIRM|nr:amidohydrolase [Natronincola ferrireducens]SDJ84011.1 hypothetical protein SAMN05660472_00082 [Natronincola ferrireducens]
MKRKAICFVLLVMFGVISVMSPIHALSAGGDLLADKVLINGVVYTVDQEDTMAEAIAIKDGKILAVGTTQEVKAYIGPHTEVMDLEGKMVLPGLMDSHIHPPGTALTELYDISLSATDSKEVILAKIQQYVDNNPDLNAYYGRGWSVGAFDGDETSRGPKKEHLDAISPDIPILLTSYDGHSTWVNSKALEMAGITKDTLNPEGGVIEKDPVTGEPWGTIKGYKSGLLPPQEYTHEMLVEGMKAFQDFMHSLGYTGFFNAGWDEEMFEVVKELEDKGELKMWARISGRLDIRSGEAVEEQIQRLLELRDTYNSDLYKVISGKIFIDGVVEGVTAKLLEPYEEEAGEGSEHYGLYYWGDMEALRETIIKVNSEGLSTHFHSIGDRATREALDALEYGLEQVPGEHRNVITHLQLVALEDIPRFKELGIVANVQPYWHMKEPGWWHEVDSLFLGERAEYEYPLGSFFNAGAVVASSSDYFVTEYPNALWAIETGVTRNLNNGEYYGVDDIEDMDDPTWLLNKEERASLKDMIRSFTINNAYSLFLDDKTGSIEVGKYADLVVLEEDLFSINPLDIDGVEILYTIFQGEIVYEAEVGPYEEEIVIVTEDLFNIEVIDMGGGTFWYTVSRNR